MSTAANHRKRSHRSETYKAGVYRASTRRMIYRTAREQHNRGILGRIAGLFRRRIPQIAPVKGRVKEGAET